MKKYVVSLVMTKITAPKRKAILLASEAGRPALPDIELQNHVSICSADSAEDAYGKCSPLARQAFPGFKIAVQVVIECNPENLTD